MLNNCELKILGLLLRTPLELFSIHDLAKRIKLAYPHVYNSVKNLEKKKLLRIKVAGKSNLCRISFNHPDELAPAAIESRQLFLAKHPALNNLTLQLKEALADELYILLLFGSYAKGTAAAKSDIDLFFIIRDKSHLEDFRKKVGHVLSKLQYNVEFEVSTVEWFYGMLKEKNTVGREIFKTNLILHNVESYLYLVQKHDQQQGY